MSPLTIRRGSTQATIEPEVGFNLYRFEVDGFDYMHAEPGFPARGKPTHSGTPILFPWPNRIAGAGFTWDGTEYPLPVTESATGTSLHGFGIAVPWRIVALAEDEVTGEFVLSRDAAGSAWPADGRLQVTYRVEPAALIATCEVFAPGGDLPYGLGFHPYLRVPGPFDQWLLQVDARQRWPLSGMVPSGPAEDVPADLDFRRPRRLGDQHLDDVLTGLPDQQGLAVRASLMSMASRLTIASDEQFREYVLYTPPGRDSVAIEPYTCATDAVHLQERGIDAGWRVLRSGGKQTFTWRIDVE